MLLAQIEQASLGQRIRARRARRGLTGTALAAAAQISPSYLSLIEAGKKRPTREVAERLALALADPPAAYGALLTLQELGPRAVSRTDGRLALYRLQPVAAAQGDNWPVGFSSGADIFSGDSEPSSSVVEARHLSPPRPRWPIDSGLGLTTLPVATEDHELAEAPARVPLYPAGTDPEPPDGERPAPTRHLAIDASLLPLPRGGHYFARYVSFFAWELTHDSLRRFRGALSPGDVVVFVRYARLPSSFKVDPEMICAVRHRGAVELSRVYAKGDVFLLLPGRLADVESLDLPGADPDRFAELLVGVGLLTIKRQPVPLR